MILRHVTLKRRLPKIYKDWCLKIKASTRVKSSDSDYVAFELNPTSNVLVNKFHIFKSNPIDTFTYEDIFELQFDADKLTAAGKELKRLSQNKIQLKGYVESEIISSQEYDSIGEFIFINDNVSLDYLTSDSKKKLEDYMNNLKI